ncbi:MAG: MASE1 domain-containing protein [Myxococcales bacterium]
MDVRSERPSLPNSRLRAGGFRVLEAALIASSYVAAAVLNNVIALGPQRLCAVWLPAGVAVTALLWRGRDALPGVACGALIVSLWRTPLQGAATTWFGDVLGPVCSAMFLRRRPQFDPQLLRLLDLRRLAVACALGAAVSAGFRVLGLLGATQSAPFGSLLHWWLADTLGAMLTVPLAATFRRADVGSEQRRPWPERVLAFSTLVSFALLGFTPVFGRPSLAYPPLIWCALRFGLRGGTVAVALLYLLATVLVFFGVGPLVRPIPSETVLHLQVTLASVALVGLVIGTATVERAALVERLETALQLHRAVVHSSPLATVAIDESARVTAWNPAAERMFGYRPDEVLGRPLPIVPPPLTAEFEQEWKRVRESSTPTSPYETLRLRRDGSLLQVRVSAAPLIDASGRTVGSLALLEDIEVRRKAELARDRLAAVVEATTELVALADAEGQLIYLNPAGRRLLGFDESFDPTQLTMSDLHAEPERARLPGEILGSSREHGRLERRDLASASRRNADSGAAGRDREKGEGEPRFLCARSPRPA